MGRRQFGRNLHPGRHRRNLITYDHDGSETTSDSLQFDVTDGAGGTVNDVTFAFTITPQNDSPAILTNAGLTVNEGVSGTITNSELNENDPDDSGTGLIYTVTDLPDQRDVEEQRHGGGTQWDFHPG